MKRIILITMLIMVSLVTRGQTAVTVSTALELKEAVINANTGGDPLILLNDGIYTLDDMLWISADNVRIRSVSRNRSSVIIEGQGMTGSVSHIFNVAGSHFTAEDMTLRDVANHLIQIHGNNNSDNPVLRNLILQNAFEQLVKISYSAGSAIGSDNGLIENCLFEYTAGIGPQWYIGGIDGHQCTDYTIRNCVFKHIQSPENDLAEHAIHFWSDSVGTRVERNWIINCDRGIGFGLGDRGHQGGIICNNMIYHDANDFNADVGIGLESVTGAHVYNNTIYFASSYQNAIEYRFEVTRGNVIENNLTNRRITARNDATSTVQNNITSADSSWFTNVSNGNLHLSSAIASVIDQGLPVSGLTDDFDGDPRPQGSGIDIGCDEWTGSSSQPIIIDLRMNQSRYEAGDPFQVFWSGWSQDGTISGDSYLLLEVLGDYWFYPTWGSDLDFWTTEFQETGPTEIIIFDFIWPQIAPLNLTVTFWTCAFNTGSFNLISNIEHESIHV